MSVRIAIAILPLVAACSHAPRACEPVLPWDGAAAAPAVYWKHPVSGREVQLLAKGALKDSPFGTLAAALDATAKRRGEAEAKFDVFVIVRDARGWQVSEYGEKDLFNVGLDKIATHDLPLGADPDKPLTYVTDSEGRVGALTASDHEYSLDRVAKSASDWSRIPEPPIPAAMVSGFVAPRCYVNHSGITVWDPAYVLCPGPSLETLSSGLKWISSRQPKLPIRAIGSRHSWSPVAACDKGVTVIPDGWKGIFPLGEGESALPPEESKGLYRVYSGVRIRELNEELWKRGRSIAFLGGFDGQTIGGVLPTGTHGSVLAFGPLADMVRSIDLVRFDGSVLRVEPSRITSEAFLRASAPQTELRVDKDLFDAARVGLGSFGVIHSLVLQTVPRYWLREVRTVTTMDAVSARMANGNIYGFFATRERVLAKLANPEAPDTDPPGLGFPDHPRRAFHFELLWNPYDGKTLITTRHWVDDPERKDLERDDALRFGDKPPLNRIRIVGIPELTDEYTRPFFTEFMAQIAGDTSIRMVENIEKVAPREVPKLIDGAIDGLRDVNGYTQRSYNVFNIGRATNNLPSLSATISVPLKDDLWLKAIDVIAGVSSKQLDDNIVMTGPIALRFVAGSSAFLADPTDVCKFEIIFGGTGELTQRNASALVSAYYRALREKLGDVVRLHFGQLIPAGTLDSPDSNGKFPVERTYPSYAQWRKLRDSLDPEGRGLTPWLAGILPPTR